MPIVFVHGVNNRDDNAYRENEASRNGFLREIIAPSLGIKPDMLQLFSPYWGAFGARFAWGMSVLPHPDEQFESFGAGPESEARGRVAILLAESAASDDILEHARRDLSATVDLVYASAMASATSEDEARAIARSYLRSSDYAIETPQPHWVATATPHNFVDQLLNTAHDTQDESFGAEWGVVDSLKEGLSRLINVAPDAVSVAAGRLLRKKLSMTVARFAGDAFVYLADRGTKDSPGEIVNTVLRDLRAAHAARTVEDDKLVVIAHSFGGEIMYDILTCFDPSLQVDVLVTVGSQVGLFEEMKLYLVSHHDVPPNAPLGRIPRPPSVAKWYNVFDSNDVLSFRLEPIMHEVQDFHYDTGFGSLSAHGGYFMRPSFYKRVAAHLSIALSENDSSRRQFR